MSVEFILAVLTYAAPYALCALGMQLIFLPTRAVNFAQGDLMVLGATIFAVIVEKWFPGHWLLGILLSTVIAALFALVLSGPVFRRSDVRAWGPSSVTLCFIGLSLLVNAVSYWIGHEENFALRATQISHIELLRGLSRNRDATEGLSLLLALVATLGLPFLMRARRLAKRLDAIGTDRDAFAMWEQGATWGRWGTFFGIFVGVVSGVLVAPLNYADPHVGITYGFRAFALLLLARGSPFGIAFGAVGLAFVEQLVSAYWPRVFADFIPAVLVIFLALWRYGGLRIRVPFIQASWWRVLSTRRLFEKLFEEEYEQEHTRSHETPLNDAFAPITRAGSALARAIPLLLAANAGRLQVVLTRAYGFVRITIVSIARLFDASGILAVFVTVWCIIYAFAGDRGAFNAIATVLALTATLPLQWIVQRWLRETWLCTGALALVGGYGYAWACHRSPFIGIGVACAFTAIAALLVLWCTAFLRKLAVPLVTITIHLAILAGIIHSRMLGGAEGLHGLPRLVSTRTSASMLLLLGAPALMGTAFVFLLSKTARGRQLKMLGRDPVLYETLGGHRLRTAALPVLACAALLGCASALSVTVNRSCAQGSFGVLISLLPVIAIATTQRHHPIIAPFVMAGPLLLPHLLPQHPAGYRLAVALFVLAALIASQRERRRPPNG